MTTLEEITIIHAPIERCFDLARSVEVHLAGNVHCGEQAVAAGGVTSGLVGLGERVTWRAKHFGVWHQLTSRDHPNGPPAYFQDVMVAESSASCGTIISFARSRPPRPKCATFSPSPRRSRYSAVSRNPFLRRYMRNLLRERNAAIQQAAAP
jgi:hypothetical protein